VAATQWSASSVVFRDLPSRHERLLDVRIRSFQAEELVDGARDPGERRRRAPLLAPQREHEPLSWTSAQSHFGDPALAHAGFTR